MEAIASSKTAGVLHSIIGWPIFVLVTAVVGVGALAQLLALPFDPKRRIAGSALHLGWGRLLWFAQPFWRTTRTGLSHVGEGPYLVVANHASILDIPLLFGLPLPLRVVARQQLFDIPVLGRLLSLSAQIPVDLDSDTPGQQLVEGCRQALSAGHSVLIFPEGTRTEDGSLQSFQRGAFRLAKDLKVPVLPVAITGTAAILPKHGLMATGLFSPVQMSVLAPLDPEPWSTARRMSNEVHRRLTGELGRQRGLAS